MNSKKLKTKDGNYNDIHENKPQNKETTKDGK